MKYIKNISDEKYYVLLESYLTSEIMQILIENAAKDVR